VEVPPNQVNQISGGVPEQVDKAIDTIRPVLLKACRPMVSVWKKLNKEMSIDNVEVELQLGFFGQEQGKCQPQDQAFHLAKI
jgi:hypothetical protein